MNTRSTEKRIISCFLSLLLVGMFSTVAWADYPTGNQKKGFLPAWSTQLEEPKTETKEPAVSPSDDLRPVRIGLRYGDTGDRRADLSIVHGTGILIGGFDETNTFQPLSSFDETEIAILADSFWHLLIGESGMSPLDAVAKAEEVGGFVGHFADGFRVLWGSFASWEEAETAISSTDLNGTVYAAPEGAVLVCGRGMLWYSERRETLGLMADGTDAPVTVFGGDRFSGGFAFPIVNGSLQVVNVVPLEDYVKGVLPYEMSASWPIEALKAQAVCARSYVVFRRGEYGDYGFDVTADTRSQVYRGLTASSTQCNEAADATRGQLLRYQGELCEAYYFSSDGGATENCKHVFGYERPYLCGKLDPFEASINVSNNSWAISRSSRDLQTWLADKGYLIGPVTEVEASYSDFGNVTVLRCTDDDGNCVTLDGRRSYTGLGLDSCHFTVTGDGHGFRFTGRGWGHNCGLSQWGAYAMAKNYGYSYEDILGFYFTGATIG